MHKPSYRHSGYFKNCIERDELRKTIPRALKILKKHKFDAVAFRGLSGALAGPLLAYLLKKTLLAVRKPDELERCHGYYIVEGDAAAKKYVIVDDFVSSGSTVQAIVTEVHELAPQAVCIGVLSMDEVQKESANVRSIRKLAKVARREPLRELVADPKYQEIIS